MEFIGGCVMFVVSIAFSLALTSFFLRLGGCFKCYDWFVWEDLFQIRVLLYRFPVFVYDRDYVVTELCVKN